VAIQTEVEISSNREAFRVEAHLAAHEGGRAVFERSWDEQAPRVGI
jgi:hypothetical protein